MTSSAPLLFADFFALLRGAVRAGLRTEISLGGWRSGALQSERGLLTRSFHPGEGEQAPSFVLETCVADSVAGAQERLVDWLAGVQSSQTMRPSNSPK